MNKPYNPYANAVIEVSTEKLRSNILALKSQVSKETKFMAMVKAFAYGHGAYEISKFIEDNHLADYLAVASIGRGIELREKGITLPIMVTHPVRPLFEQLIRYKLEPTLHHMKHASDFSLFLKEKKIQNYPVHIKFNTGMNRFGFNLEDIEQAIEICQNTSFNLKSVMSHLSCSDMPEEDKFTLAQIKQFEKIKSQFTTAINYSIDFHILNTNGILRFPQYAYNMVRAGIGIFGASEINEAKQKLKPTTTLFTRLAQIRKVKKGDSLSYARSGRTDKEDHIGVISIGYADGFPRSLGNGRWKVEINGQLYPTIGNVCMDYTLISLGENKDNLSANDRVIVFGNKQNIFDFAHAQNTITYEALTNLGERVERILI